MRYSTKVKLGILVGFPIAIGLVLGANQTRAGAFLPWHLSIVYWSIISLMTWWTLAAITWLITYLLKPWSPPKLSLWLLGGILGSFFARYVIYVTASAFHPFMTNADLRAMPQLAFDLAFVRYYATNWSAILVMWVAACWSKDLLLTKATTTVEQPMANPITPEPSHPITTDIGFLARMPKHIGREIIALHSEDHYLRVYTKLGETLILARLSDAIDICDANGIPGTRVHRSWWVANASVTQSTIVGRKIFLLLLRDINVPVSQGYKLAAANAGLLTLSGKN